MIDAHYAIGRGMFKETDMSSFQNEVLTCRGEEGLIDGAFGKSGKFKLYFKDGIRAIENDAGHVNCSCVSAPS